MKPDERNRLYELTTLALLVLIMLGLLANVLLTAGANRTLVAMAMNRGNSEALPCAAIPTRFVLQEPACAQKLLETMNVTNVRIRAP